MSVANTRSRGGVEVACRVGLHEEDLRCRARVEVFRVTCGSERVRVGRACDAVPEVGDERDVCSCTVHVHVMMYTCTFVHYVYRSFRAKKKIKRASSSPS